jgi:hypothetical protein
LYCTLRETPEATVIITAKPPMIASVSFVEGLMFMYLLR